MIILLIVLLRTIWLADGENTILEIINEMNSCQISPSQESSNDGTENNEENIQQNEGKDCVTLKTFKNDPIRVAMD